MIGQKYLKRYVSTLLKDGNFPRFAIFVGPSGSGRKTFVNEIIRDLTDGLYIESGIKVDDVREVIADAYKVHSTAVYFIPDADNMSNAAKNALLKVTEEPPNNAFFIMTLEDEANTLPTIRSRAQIFYMDMYLPKDLKDYANTLGVESESQLNVLESVCDTPGEVKALVEAGVDDFYNYVKLVIENVVAVTVANALKMPSRIALKSNADGFDLKLFWRMFQRLCIADATVVKAEWAIITSKYLMSLKTKGVNKQMLIDNWIFDVRDSFTRFMGETTL